MRPRWLTVERAYLHLLGRAGSSSHKWWATTAQPSPAVETVPTVVKVTFALSINHACTAGLPTAEATEPESMKTHVP